MSKRKKKAPLSSNNKVFLLFLILSSLFWFFNTLSENYSYLINYKLHYQDLPEDLVFQQEPDKQITAQVEVSGFTILGHKLNTKYLNLSFNRFTHDKNDRYYYLPGRDIPNLQKQLNDTKIIRFITDTISLHLGKLKTKKIPVRPMVHMIFKPGYKLTEQLAITPDSILITGSERIIDSIKSISTITTNINDIDSDFSQDILLETLSNKVKTNKKEVRLSGKVAKFTQGSIEVPITVSRVPKDIQVALFPKTTQVHYEVSFDNYTKVSEKSFTVSCDYSAIKNNSKSTLPVKITKKPDFITHVSLSVDSVNYFIRK